MLLLRRSIWLRRSLSSAAADVPKRSPSQMMQNLVESKVIADQQTRVDVEVSPRLERQSDIWVQVDDWMHQVSQGKLSATSLHRTFGADASLKQLMPSRPPALMITIPMSFPNDLTATESMNQAEDWPELMVAGTLNLVCSKQNLVPYSFDLTKTVDKALQGSGLLTMINNDKKPTFVTENSLQPIKDGADDVSVSSKELVITSNLLDAVAIHDKVGCAVAVMHFGQTSPHRWTSLLRGILDRFDKVTLWMRPDSRIKDIDAFSRSIVSNVGRIRLVQSEVVTTNDKFAHLVSPFACLMLNQSLESVLKEARVPKHDAICQLAGSLLKDVRFEFANRVTVMGAQSHSLPSMNRILKGLRPGEMTIVSGATGTGKTTVLSQLSLDYCCQGVPTLWGSFELRNVRLMKKMLCQFGDRDFSSDMTEFEKWVEKFSALPMYFMKYFGSTNVEDVLGSMRHAVQAHNVQHVILDNLQFMLSNQGNGSLDRFELADRVVAQLRSFASQYNCHVTLVVHPRKEDDNAALMLSSVSGTSKATQEADNVILLQKIGKSRYLDIRKNRFDGELGIIPFGFDKQSQKIYEVQYDPKTFFQEAKDSVEFKSEKSFGNFKKSS